MVSLEAKNGFNSVSCGTFRRDEASARLAVAKREPRLSVRLGGAQGGVSGALWENQGLMVRGAPLRKLTGAPEVPHGTRRRRLSSITRAPCRRAMGVLGLRRSGSFLMFALAEGHGEIR